MNAFTGKELTAFYVKVPDYHLPLAIDLLADIFINSLFNLDDIDKEKSVVLQEISMVEDTPDEYIHDIFEKHFWDGHSLGMPVLGTRDSVDAFERSNVMRFFEERYRGDNLVISAVGNMEHEQLVDLVAKLFGTLPAIHVKFEEKQTANHGPLHLSRERPRAAPPRRGHAGPGDPGQHPFCRHPHEFRLRRFHELPALPGDPREKGACLCRALLHRFLPRHGDAQHLRGDLEGQDAGSHRHHPGRDEAHENGARSRTRNSSRRRS